MKSILLYGIISGLAFALCMSAFDHFADNNFNFVKSIVYFLIFGTSMGLTQYYMSKKREN